MIAQDILLGRPRLAKAEAARVALPSGGGFARAILVIALVAVTTLEESTPDPLVAFGSFLHRGIESWSGLPFIVTPLELLLGTGLVAALVSAAVGAQPDIRRAGLGWPVLALAVALAFGLIRGALGGGDLYVALWELRYLVYVPVCYWIARLALRRAEHVTALLRWGLIAAGVFAIEGAYRKFALINAGLLGTVPEFFYEHGDVIFLASFLVLVFSSVAFGAKSFRTLGLLLAPFQLLTLLASERRSGIIVLLVGLLVVALTLFVVKRKAFFAWALPILVGGVIFLAITWNATGLLGQPARAVRSLSEPDARDAASNIYRVIETYDISVTLHDDPILGVGFGREFQMVALLPDLSWWPFWRYETHNNVLWIWLKTGAVGYVAFWTLIGTAMSRAAFAAKRLTEPDLRCAALFCLGALVGAVVFGYVDLAFVSGRTTVLLGVALGILAVLDRFREPAPQVSSARLRVR